MRQADDGAAPARRRGGQGHWPWLALAHLSVVLVHLAMGSIPVLVMVMTLISLTGWASLMRRETWPGDVFLFVLGLYSGGFGLVAKALYGQPLQTNLDQPVLSAAALALGFFSFALALLLVRPAELPARVAEIGATMRSAGFQRRFAVPVLGLGAAALLAHLYLRPRFGGAESGAGFGGLGALALLMVLGQCLTFWRRVQGGDRAAGRILLLGGLLTLGLTLAANTRREFVEFLLVLGWGAFALRLRPRPWLVMLGLALAAATVFYLTPLVHLTRFGAEGAGLSARVAAAWQVLAENDFSAARLADAERQFLGGFAYSYRDGGSYLFPASAGFDRFALIFPLDQVIRSAQAAGTMGLPVFLRQAVEGVLPSFLIDKDLLVGSDLVAWRYGLREFGSVARPVLGFAATAYAAGGLWAVAALPMLVGAPVIFLLNRLFGPVRQSPLGHLFAVMAWYLAEQSVDGMIVFALRNALLAWAACVVLVWLHRRSSAEVRAWA